MDLASAIPASPLQPHRVGPYGGATERARITIALHELAHILQDKVEGRPVPISVIHVPGFQPDGASTATSMQNTQLVLKTCRPMIERP